MQIRDPYLISRTDNTVVRLRALIISETHGGGGGHQGNSRPKKGKMEILSAS